MINKIYQRLLAHFGPQGWWPADTPFEVCVGAILTQNTAWSNVEKAIANIKQAGLMDFHRLCAAPEGIIAGLIRPAGYFNIKARRLKIFLKNIQDHFGSFEAFHLSTDRLRQHLLSITGIGPETADSIVLYAFERPTFVVDAYTKRILTRHRLIDEEADYYEIKEFFESHTPEDVEVYKEYHALIVAVGKNFCKKSRPLCEDCPLKEINGGPVIESPVNC